jgi:hypothetical protein
MLHGRISGEHAATRGIVPQSALKFFGFAGGEPVVEVKV